MTTPKLGLHTIDYSVQGWDTILTTDMEILDDAVVVDATAENDFIVAGADPFAWAKKTKVETAAILKDQFPQAITDNHVVTMDSADAADDEYARFTASGIEGRTRAEVLADVGKFAAAPTADTWDGLTVTLTAHENMALGKVCFINSDGEAALADADAAATMPVWVMATAATNADAAGVFLISGVIHLHTLAPAWTKGSAVYAGSGAGPHTAGAMNQTAPAGNEDIVQVLGVALDADVLLFNPSSVTVEVTA